MMFGIGGMEIIVILLIAVILIKPKDLPGFIRKIGQVLGEIKKFSRSLNRAVRRAEYAAKLDESREEDTTPPADQKHSPEQQDENGD